MRANKKQNKVFFNFFFLSLNIFWHIPRFFDILQLIFIWCCQDVANNILQVDIFQSLQFYKKSWNELGSKNLTNRLFFRHMNLNTYVNYKICSKFVLKTIDLYLEVDSRLRPITLYKHQKGTVQPLLLATKAQRESIFFEVFKVQLFWEGHKNLELSSIFDIYLLNQLICQNNWKITAKFCGLLRKAELYLWIRSPYFLFLKGNFFLSSIWRNLSKMGQVKK